MTTDQQREEAALAVREFARLRPTLEGFVRALTGSSRMRLEAGPTSGTDGKTVFLRPPIALASRDPHDRGLCDERDEHSLPSCPACARSEAVYTTLFHEISHIVSGSMKKESRQLLREAVLRGAQRGTAQYRKFIDVQTDYPSVGPVDAYDFLTRIDRVLLAWIRVMDDARIDAASFVARPGVADMRWNQTHAILTRGVEVEGEYHPWSDRHIEQQFPIAALVATQGHSLEHFAPEVAQTLALPEFADLLGRIPADNFEAAEQAVAWLGALNALGLYDLPLPEPDDEDDNESGEPDAQSPGDDQAGEQPGAPGPDDAEGDADSDDPGAGDGSDGAADADDDLGPGDGGGAGDPGDSGNGDLGEPAGDPQGAGAPAQQPAGSADDGGADTPEGSVDGGPETDQDGLGDGGGKPSGLGQDAQAEADPVGADPDAARELIERHFSGLDHADVDRVLADADAGSGHEEAEAVVHGGEEPLDDKAIEAAIAQAAVFDTFSANVSGLTIARPGEGLAYTGRSWKHSPIDDRVLAPSVMRARRVFSDSKLDKHLRNLRRGKLNQGALARRAPFDDNRLFRRTLRAEGIDFEVIIGLDISGSTADGCITLIKQAGEGLANVLHRVGVNFSMFAHTTDNPMRWTVLEQVMYPVKTLADPWGARQRQLLADLRPVAGSLDGHNLQFYRKLLDRSRARKRLLVYFTDGEIPETNRSEELEILKSEIKAFDRSGYSFLGVGIGNDAPKKYGLDTVRIDSSDDIVTVIKEIEKRITH